MTMINGVVELGHNSIFLAGDVSGLPGIRDHYPNTLLDRIATTIRRGNVARLLFNPFEKLRYSSSKLFLASLLKRINCAARVRESAVDLGLMPLCNLVAKRRHRGRSLVVKPLGKRGHGHLAF